jgi:cytochrome oxidase Cu insertion factor (SCO1/SenC/PrrC family)
MGAALLSSIPGRAVMSLTAMLAVALLGFGCGSSGRSGAASQAQAAPGSEFAGAALPAGVRAPRFVLSDQRGRPVTLGGPAGQVTLVAFLDSRCGRTCFLIAQQIRGALDRLQRPVRTLFVSVDPRADTRASVAGFLASASLTGRVRWLAAPAATLPRVWRAYRIVTPASGRAAFERSASVLLIDRPGDERVLYQQEQLTPEALAGDIGKLQGG